MEIRRLLSVAAAFALAVTLAWCGPSGQVTNPTPDTGKRGTDRGPVADCVVSDDCAKGDCIEGACVLCTSTTCGSGLLCTLARKCLAPDAGGSHADTGALPAGLDASGPRDASGPACTSRQQCAGGMVCRAKSCEVPDPAGKCGGDDECLLGQVCNAAQGNLCVAMCISNLDCVGITGSGGLPLVHCDTATNRCKACVGDSDCSAGQHCTNQRCGTTTIPCTPPDRSACGTGACVLQSGAYACGPCAVAADCGSLTCSGGACIPKATCAGDADCQKLSPGRWCAGGNCQPGCAPSPSCGADCCSAGQTCNTATHACEAAACNNCNGSCAANQHCDVPSCTCIATACNNCSGTCGGDQHCDVASCTCVANPPGPDAGSSTPECDLTDCSGCPSGLTCYCPLSDCANGGLDCTIAAFAGSPGTCE